MADIIALLRRIAGPILAPRASSGGLDECRRCRCRLVNPVQWHVFDERHWWMRLRCGECGFVREAVVPDADARRFDRELDGGVAEIAAVVRRFDQADMAAQLEALAVALERDVIGADDFSDRRGET